MSNYFTKAAARDFLTTKAAARDFLNGSCEDMTLPENWVQGVYEIKGDLVVTHDQNEQMWVMSVGEFVGGVAYALAAEGKLPLNEATPTKVADVSFHIGMLIAQREAKADLAVLGIGATWYE